ncbi:unnamed protein product [Closterium sp. Naga37s-1]|nr:unnamed protein product [Closterium sp. Naga37s-1]
MGGTGPRVPAGQRAVPHGGKGTEGPGWPEGRSPWGEGDRGSRLARGPFPMGGRGPRVPAGQRAVPHGGKGTEGPGWPEGRSPWGEGDRGSRLARGPFPMGGRGPRVPAGQRAVPHGGKGTEGPGWPEGRSPWWEGDRGSRLARGPFPIGGRGPRVPANQRAVPHGGKGTEGPGQPEGRSPRRGDRGSRLVTCGDRERKIRGGRSAGRGARGGGRGARGDQGDRGARAGGRGGRGTTGRARAPLLGEEAAIERTGTWRERHDRPERTLEPANGGEAASDTSPNGSEFIPSGSDASEGISLGDEEEFRHDGGRGRGRRTGAGGIPQAANARARPVEGEVTQPSEKSPADLANDESIWQLASTWDVAPLVRVDQPFLEHGQCCSTCHV